MSLSTEQINTLKDEGLLHIDLTQYQHNLSGYIKSATKKFSQMLTDYFSSSDDFFANAKVNFSHADSFIDLSQEFKQVT